MPVSAAYGSGLNIAENLDRGIVAVNTGNGMMVSWRFLANDNDKSEFRLYRNDTLIYTSKPEMATSFLDKGGNASSKYRVDTYVGDKKTSSDTCTMISGNGYFDIPMNIPAGGTSPDGVAYGYSANDCSVGDVDGDGVYEIFVKWDPSNSHDNSQSGYTGNVYIDCYRLTGEQLWRVDLGKNIRAGAHYTQYLVADFDGDGKCEMTCKTADGTVDGKGKMLGDGSRDYRNSGGYILDGPEYYSLFDCETGAIIDTVSYEFPRGTVKQWGDNYGNRCDRFLGTVAYLDGVHPSAVSIRGYYTRMTAVAYDVVNKKLVKRWAYDSGFNEAKNTGFGNGNHNCMPADVDNDGKDEVIVGAVAFDDNGKILWCTNLGHGDAMHLGDFLPDRPGMEVWVCHEHEPYGVSLIDAANGQLLVHENRDKDTGRCCADNVWTGNPGGEFWGSRSSAVFDGSGKTINMSCPAMNFVIWWDGDLERELLDDITITKINQSGGIDELFKAAGCASCNGTKATPNLSADLFGDWREELMLHTSDSKYLRIFCTPYETQYRITTLMHDTQYRSQVASQQNCYNQPPHTSFYLGSDQPLPDRPAVTINGSLTGSTSPAAVDTAKAFRIKNANSGLYLANVDDNAIQVPANLNGNTIWRFEEADEDSYYVVNVENEYLTLQDGNILGVYGGKDQAVKIQLWRTAGGFIMTTDGEAASTCIEVKNAYTDAGGNVQVWEKNGHKCQSWNLENISYHLPEADFIPGDMDNNGRINAADVTILKRELLAPALSRIARRPGDLDANGEINIADNVAIQKYLLGENTIGSGFYAAIDAAYYLGISESVNEGFHDSAYLNLDNVADSFVEFRVFAPSSGTYELTIHTANGSTVNRSMSVSANGSAPKSIDFNSTGTWTTWSDITTSVMLMKEGMNTIRFQSETEQGGPNIDYIIIQHK
ncbi:MAG: dockerin type I domain-containing protein [Oscillospiraceae bacterium]|nr:dockerin type I domain-containing protein [Oscillospiraceae bacterium]